MYCHGNMKAQMDRKREITYDELEDYEKHKVKSSVDDILQVIYELQHTNSLRICMKEELKHLDDVLRLIGKKTGEEIL